MCACLWRWEGGFAREGERMGERANRLLLKCSSLLSHRKSRWQRDGVHEQAENKMVSREENNKSDHREIVKQH